MMLWLVAAGLAMAPLLVGGRVATRLTAAPWTSRHPRAALTLWQAIGLAGALGAVGVGLVAAVTVFPHGLHLLGHRIIDGHGVETYPAVALTWSAAVIAWLLGHAGWRLAMTGREQRRQRLLVDVLADHSAAHDAYVLPSDDRLAYCVPGPAPRVVVSRGAVQALSQEQLAAVLAHERAHARGRHDLVLVPFIALSCAFPWLPVVRTAREAVRVLLEMIADDRACREHSPSLLAAAIVSMAAPGSAPSSAAPALSQAGVVRRVERLVRARAVPRWAGAVAYCGATALLSGPVAVLVAPIACGLLLPG